MSLKPGSEAGRPTLPALGLKLSPADHFGVVFSKSNAGGLSDGSRTVVLISVGSPNASGRDQKKKKPIGKEC